MSNVISWMIAVAFAYFANAKYVFGIRLQIKAFCEFFVARIGSLIIECALMFLAVNVAGFNDKIVKIIVQVLVTLINYITQLSHKDFLLKSL